MIPEDARKERYELIDLDGYICLFTNIRLDRSTIPQSLYCYDVRDSDYCDGAFAEIRPSIMVNYWGTIICKRPLPLDNLRSYYPKSGENYLPGIYTLADFMEMTQEDFDEIISEKNEMLMSMQ